MARGLFPKALGPGRSPAREPAYCRGGELAACWWRWAWASGHADRPQPWVSSSFWPDLAPGPGGGPHAPEPPERCPPGGRQAGTWRCDQVHLAQPRGLPVPLRACRRPVSGAGVVGVAGRPWCHSDVSRQSGGWGWWRWIGPHRRSPVVSLHSALTQLCSPPSRQRAACTAHVVSFSRVRAVPAPPVQQPDPEEGRGPREVGAALEDPSASGRASSAGLCLGACVHTRVGTPRRPACRLSGSGYVQGLLSRSEAPGVLHGADGIQRFFPGLMGFRGFARG